MGYDLTPRNKALERFHFGAFSWVWMLDAGVGLPLGCGMGIRPGEYIARSCTNGGNPYTNDGMRVTAEQARAMAFAADGLVAVERGIRREWERLADTERARLEDADARGLYPVRKPVREDFVERVERFSEWAYKSRGFAIW